MYLLLPQSVRSWLDAELPAASHSVICSESIELVP